MKAFYENRTYSSEIPVSASYASNLDFVAHWHSDIEIVFVCEGRIGVGINSEYKMLEKGEIAICGSNNIHYYHTEGDVSSKIMMLIFNPDILSSFKYWPEKLMISSAFIDKDYLADQEMNIEALPVIKIIFEKIIGEISQKNNLYTVSTTIGIAELCMTLFRCFPCYLDECKRKHSSLPVSVDIKPMQKALKYIEENYTNDITLELIAEEVGLSCFYFSRLFKKTTGMNFNVYLTRLRLDKAQTLIKSTSKTILEIAYETGFSSIRTFNRAFKTGKGCTPGSLRT
jgi:AraC-like DNA-binding protein